MEERGGKRTRAIIRSFNQRRFFLLLLLRVVLSRGSQRTGSRTWISPQPSSVSYRKSYRRYIRGGGGGKSVANCGTHLSGWLEGRREKGGGLGQVAAVNTLCRPWCGIRRCFFYSRVGRARGTHKNRVVRWKFCEYDVKKTVEQHVVATCWYKKWAKVGLFCEKKAAGALFS